LRAAEGPAHAPRFTCHKSLRHVENTGDNMLHFGGMLRGGMNKHFAIFAGNGERYLPFEIEMLLTSYPELSAGTQRRFGQRARNIASAEGVIG
jgi:hypothetical protein